MYLFLLVATEYLVTSGRRRPIDLKRNNRLGLGREKIDAGSWGVMISISAMTILELEDRAALPAFNRR